MTSPDHPASVLALLREIEWSGSRHEMLPCCPTCGGWRGEHNFVCRLAATILALEAQEAAPSAAEIAALRARVVELEAERDAALDGLNEARAKSPDWEATFPTLVAARDRWRARAEAAEERLHQED